MLLRSLVDPPSRRYGLLSDPFFGTGDYYLTPPHAHVHLNIIPPRSQRSSSSGDSKQDNMFKVMMNVKQFRPEEINVKVVDDFIVVHGKHEEHADEHGFVMREFTRRYKIPEDVDPSKLNSSLSRDGILTIQAPRKVAPLPENERVIPVTIQQSAAVEEAKAMQEQQQQQQQQEQKQQSNEENK